MVARAEQSRLPAHPRWADVQSCLSVTGQSTEQLATKVLMAGALGVVGMPAAWLLFRVVGSTVPFGLAVVAGLAAGILCAIGPVVSLVGRARERRRHFRSVLGTFVDLVVLSLAGGVGIEGSLLAASQVSSDWAARRMSRVLLEHATVESHRGTPSAVWATNSVSRS